MAESAYFDLHHMKGETRAQCAKRTDFPQREVEIGILFKILEQVQAACRNERIVFPSIEEGVLIPGDPDMTQRMRLAKKLFEKYGVGENDDYHLGYIEGSLGTSSYLRDNIKFEPAQPQQIVWPTFEVALESVDEHCRSTPNSMLRSLYSGLKQNVKLAPVDEAKDTDIFNMAEREYAPRPAPRAKTSISDEDLKKHIAICNLYSDPYVQNGRATSISCQAYQQLFDLLKALRDR